MSGNAANSIEKAGEEKCTADLVKTEMLCKSPFFGPHDGMVGDAHVPIKNMNQWAFAHALIELESGRI